MTRQTSPDTIDRRAILSGAIALAASALVPPAAVRAAAFTSGALGLTINEYEDIHGPTEPGQIGEMVDLGDGSLALKTAGDKRRIITITRFVDRDDGLPYTDAINEIAYLIPTDADYIEAFDMDLTLDGPAFILRYRSKSLKERFPGIGTETTGTFAILFLLNFESFYGGSDPVRIDRYMITAGIAQSMWDR